jgi:hypothetical protein
MVVIFIKISAVIHLNCDYSRYIYCFITEVVPEEDMMASYSMKYCSKDVFKDTKPGEFQEVYGREMARFPPTPEIS